MPPLPLGFHGYCMQTRLGTTSVRRQTPAVQSACTCSVKPNTQTRWGQRSSDKGRGGSGPGWETAKTRMHSGAWETRPVPRVTRGPQTAICCDGGFTAAERVTHHKAEPPLTAGPAHSPHRHRPVGTHLLSHSTDLRLAHSFRRRPV